MTGCCLSRRAPRKDVQDMVSRKTIPRQAGTQESCPCCLHPILPDRPYDCRCSGCREPIHGHCGIWQGELLLCIHCLRGLRR